MFFSQIQVVWLRTAILNIYAKNTLINGWFVGILFCQYDKCGDDNDFTQVLEVFSSTSSEVDELHDNSYPTIR